jgi:hypothetical protein
MVGIQKGGRLLVTTPTPTQFSLILSFGEVRAVFLYVLDRPSEAISQAWWWWVRNTYELLITLTL